MRRLLVGLVLLILCAGGVVALGQPSDAPNPLAARIAELEGVYRQVVSDIVSLEAQLRNLQDQRLRLEGGIVELRRYQAQLREAQERSVKKAPTEPKK